MVDKGCNAGGFATCRWCGFGPYVGIMCPYDVAEGLSSTDLPPKPEEAAAARETFPARVQEVEVVETFDVSVEMTVSMSIDEFAAAEAQMTREIATLLGVDAKDVVLVALPGSVHLKVIVTAPTQEQAVEVAEVIHAQTPATLAVNLHAEVEAIAPVFITRVLTEVPLSTGGGYSKLVVGIGSGAGGSLALVCCLLAALRYRRHLRARHAKEAAAAEAEVEAAAAEAEAAAAAAAEAVRASSRQQRWLVSAAGGPSEASEGQHQAANKHRRCSVGKFDKIGSTEQSRRSQLDQLAEVVAERPSHLYDPAEDSPRSVSSDDSDASGACDGQHVEGAATTAAASSPPSKHPTRGRGACGGSSMRQSTHNSRASRHTTSRLATYRESLSHRLEDGDASERSSSGCTTARRGSTSEAARRGSTSEAARRGSTSEAARRGSISEARRRGLVEAPPRLRGHAMAEDALPPPSALPPPPGALPPPSALPPPLGGLPPPSALPPPLGGLPPPSALPPFQGTAALPPMVDACASSPDGDGGPPAISPASHVQRRLPSQQARERARELACSSVLASRIVDGPGDRGQGAEGRGQGPGARGQGAEGRGQGGEASSSSLEGHSEMGSSHEVRSLTGEEEKALQLLYKCNLAREFARETRAHAQSGRERGAAALPEAATSLPQAQVRECVSAIPQPPPNPSHCLPEIEVVPSRVPANADASGTHRREPCRCCARARKAPPATRG